MRNVFEDGWLSGLSGFFRSNKPFVVASLLVSLISIGCFLQAERVDYVKNDRGWRFRQLHSRWWETTLSDTVQRVKIVIGLPEKLEVWQRGSVIAKDFNEGEYDEVRLQFWASGKSTGAYSLSVKVNGREIKRYPRGSRAMAGGTRFLWKARREKPYGISERQRSPLASAEPPIRKQTM